MPDFGTAFSGMAADRKLTKEELIRAIRFMIAAEYEAVQLYTQLSDSIDDEFAIKILREIADEERVHAGEFLKLLTILDPDEAKFYAEGEKEVKGESKEGSKMSKASNFLKETRGMGVGSGGQLQRDGGSSYCICPKCGNKEFRKKGIPCVTRTCSKCGTFMRGSN